MSEKDQKSLFEKLMGVSLEDCCGVAEYEYDFKYLMKKYYADYEDNHEGDEKYQSMLKNMNDLTESLKTGDHITSWYYYKTLDEVYTGDKFDCDSSNETNKLADEIYDVLWRNDAWGENVKGNLKPDTMNSFAETFDVLANIAGRGNGGFRKAYEDYKKNRDKYAVLQEYAHYVGCLGNFVLVPAGYNKDRYSKTKDYWDLSLYHLKIDEEDKNRLDKIGMKFEKYVNMFFLWDYVDEKYDVIPLFPSHSSWCGGDRSSIYPVDEFQIFTENVNKRIRRRGMFMTSMLKIAKDNEADYKRLVGVLASDKVLGTMEKVVDELLKLKDLDKGTRTELDALQSKLKSEPLTTK